MAALPDEFMKKILQALEDEEVDVYAMGLFCMNEADMKFFSPKDRKRVKEIFQTLMSDTRHHTELLRLILEIGGRK